MYREMIKFLPEEILIYLRRSRSDDPSMTVEEVFQMHTSRLMAWMERNLDYPVPEENWYREIVSGETIAERDEFRKVLKRMESPQIKAILCIDCARLSRGDMEDCGRLIKLLRYTNTHVIIEQQNKMFDLKDEFDREAFEREIKNSNYYLEYSKKLMKRGLDFAVQNGAYVASIPPYGYRKTRVPFGTKKLPTLEIVEEDAKVVRMIFNWYTTETIGHRTIAERLNSMGVKPYRVKYWNPQSVRKILENEHYLGKIRYYAHKMDYEVSDMTVTKKKVAVKDYKLFDGLHEAIIDEETFNRVRARKNAMPRIQKSKKMRNPLSSVLYCTCGYAMTFSYRSGLPRFECPEYRRCRNASIDANEIFDIICDTLKQEMENYSAEMNSSNDDLIKKQEDKVAYLEKRLKDIAYKEISLWEKYTEDNMPKVVFENLRIKVEEEKATTEKALANAIEEMPQRIDYEARIVALHDAIDAIKNDDVSAKTKNDLIKACVEKITYSREESVRVLKKDRVEGVVYKRGWTQAVPVLDFDFNV